MKAFQCKEGKVGLPYNYYLQIQQELLSALPNHIQTITNAPKVIRTASSILKLNLLQCSLLAWLLSQSRYALFDLSASAGQMSVFEQEDMNKQLLLLILLNAYYVKNYLANDATPDVDAEVLSLLPNFKNIYTAWRPDQKLEQATFPVINKTFSRWSQPENRKKLDYNHLVNRILELSKTYNVGNQDEPALKKKRKVDERQKQISQKSEPKQPRRQEKDMINSHSMMLRSSKVHRIYDSSHDFFKHNNEDIWNYESNEVPIRKSTRRSGIMFDLGQSKFFPHIDVLDRSILDSKRGVLDSSLTPRDTKIKITSSFDQIK